MPTYVLCRGDEPFVVTYRYYAPRWRDEPGEVVIDGIEPREIPLTTDEIDDIELTAVTEGLDERNLWRNYDRD